MLDTMDTALDLIRGDTLGRWYMGKVINNVDPLGRDRIQARVTGLYDTDVGEVPWIGPIKVSPFGIGASWGVYGSPAVGSDVLILLQDNDGHYPLYMSAQVGASPGFASGSSWGFTDPWGNTLKASADKSVVFTSGSGVTINISPGGAVTVQAPADVTVNAGGNATVTSSHNTLNGATTINGATNINGALSVSGMATLSAGAAVSGPMNNNGSNIGSTHHHHVYGQNSETSAPNGP